mmetsp:Transcript_8467/g.21636  ORF Transcript_8467/g.21636 Transcript_8467/m.21636 type:complete len:321 (+) Transcript_8467:408-1370(+)
MFLPVVERVFSAGVLLVGGDGLVGLRGHEGRLDDVAVELAAVERHARLGACGGVGELDERAANVGSVLHVARLRHARLQDYAELFALRADVANNLVILLFVLERVRVAHEVLELQIGRRHLRKEVSDAVRSCSRRIEGCRGRAVGEAGDEGRRHGRENALREHTHFRFGEGDVARATEWVHVSLGPTDVHLAPAQLHAVQQGNCGSRELLRADLNERELALADHVDVDDSGAEGVVEARHGLEWQLEEVVQHRPGHDADGEVAHVQHALLLAVVWALLDVTALRDLLRDEGVERVRGGRPSDAEHRYVERLRGEASLYVA